MGILIFLCVLIGLPLLWLVFTYNRFVNLTYCCRNSWSQIDTELKRRYDLIPNLVEVVKGYAAYERQVLEDVTKARASAVASTGSPAAQARDENVLVSSLRQLFGVVEKYPDLKASDQFLRLQSELVNTEDRIQAARRFYNANVRDLNTMIQSFPSNLVASAFNFTSAEFFEVEDVGIRSAPKIAI